MKLAVIPARGGSKRIPRKNIRSFYGKPMIAWSIETAQASDCFDRIIVSTDDDEIAAVSRKHGAEVPFLRPTDLANDHTGTIPVVRHALEWCVENAAAPDLVCCIYATAPFLMPSDIIRGLDVLRDEDCDYAFSVTSYVSPIQRALRINAAGRIEMFQPDRFQSRSQDLEPAFHDAGQFYWGRPDAWTAERPIFSSNALPVMLPRHRVQDIDTPEDWMRAEWMFAAMQAIDPYIK